MKCPEHCHVSQHRLVRAEDYSLEKETHLVLELRRSVLTDTFSQHLISSIAKAAPGSITHHLHKTAKSLVKLMVTELHGGSCRRKL